MNNVKEKHYILYNAGIGSVSYLYTFLTNETHEINENNQLTIVRLANAKEDIDKQCDYSLHYLYNAFACKDRKGNPKPAEKIYANIIETDKVDIDSNINCAVHMTFDTIYNNIIENKEYNEFNKITFHFPISKDDHLNKNNIIMAYHSITSYISCVIKLDTGSTPLVKFDINIDFLNDITYNDLIPYLISEDFNVFKLAYVFDYQKPRFISALKEEYDKLDPYNVTIASRYESYAIFDLNDISIVNDKMNKNPLLTNQIQEVFHSHGPKIDYSNLNDKPKKKMDPRINKLL